MGGHKNSLFDLEHHLKKKQFLSYLFHRQQHIRNYLQHDGFLIPGTVHRHIFSG
jgi:hypothetical protein